MARSILALPLVLLVLTGCQAQRSAVTDQGLPQPNFDGPVVVAPVAPAPSALPPVAIPMPPQGHADVPAEWIPPVPANHWRWIVIHHSATPAGSAAVFDREHRNKGWDELGYHFVIGNGTLTGDGLVEVGPRWPKQKYGAHAKTPTQEYNQFGIGICLVGNFDLESPTPAQMKSLAKLTAYLMQTYHIPASHVIGHCDTKPTDCPGRNVHVALIRALAEQMMNGKVARGELLKEAGESN
jgi:hypothetical protein